MTADTIITRPLQPADLRIELEAMGVKVHTLEFYRWLIAQGRHPEYPPDPPEEQ